MTDPTDDGWPDTYSDPRNRPHPSVLRVTVESFDEMREDTLAAIEAVSEGEEQPAVVSFASVGDLRKILTDRRIELLRALMATEGAAESISAFAEDLDRDYRTVHDDVSLLADHGLLFIIEEGQSKRPYLPYERIHLDVELVGKEAGGEPTPV
jgi:predicted transcriptional regulator